jgi:rod shape-determining protein MreC
MPIYTPGHRRTMLILLLSSVLLITVDLRGNALLDGARSGFDYVFRPFEIAGEVVTRPVVRAWDGITRVDDLEAENRALRDELDAVRGDLLAAENALIQNQDMRSLLDLPSLAEYDRVTCNTIGASPSNDVQTVEIACGTVDGLRVGMPVMNAAGLVGKITRANPETALVRLLTDPSYHIAVKVVGTQDPPQEEEPVVSTPSGLPVDSLPDIVDDLTSTTTTSTSTSTTTTTSVPPGSPPSSVDGLPGDVSSGLPNVGGATTSTTTTTTTTLPLVTRETGLLSGVGLDRLPRVSLISDSPQFGRPRVGDAVLTAGGGEDLAPPDLPIGRVANVITLPGTEGLRLEVEPNADLSRLEFLTVVLFQPPNEVPGL